MTSMNSRGNRVGVRKHRMNENVANKYKNIFYKEQRYWQ